MMLRLQSATRRVIICFSGRGERRSQHPCIFMRRQTKISPNGYIFKPEYSGRSCIVIKCNCDDKIDTFFKKSKDCDGQEMGV